jgi:hypothetical protein
MMTSTGQPGIVQLVEESAKGFIASLNSDEVALFVATNTAQRLLEEIETENSAHKDTSISRKISTALLPFIAGLEQYGNALDVFANGNDILCPLWGSIRIVLMVSKCLVC